jgi:hypothetical protein
MRQILGVSALTIALVAAGCADTSTPLPSGANSLESAVRINEAAEQAGLYHAHLSGAAEVPPVDTRARGQVTFRLSDDGESLEFRLVVANIENVTMAHIHLGPEDGTGPVVVWLYPEGPPPVEIAGRSQGVLAEGTITADDLMGELEGMELSDLIEAISAGNTYVNVHTTQNGPGEIRGQLD